jgi:isopropylmalate/homocitrate/citramalate synthase
LGVDDTTTKTLKQPQKTLIKHSRALKKHAKNFKKLAKTRKKSIAIANNISEVQLDKSFRQRHYAIEKAQTLVRGLFGLFFVFLKYKLTLS